MENKHEMSWVEAQSHARKMVVSLRAFEQIEGVLHKAALAEQATREAEKALAKAVSNLKAVATESAALDIKLKEGAARAKAHETKARAEAQKITDGAKEARAALLKSQQEELAQLKHDGAEDLDELDARIQDRLGTLTALDGKIEAANTALEALRKGLAGLG